MKYSKEKIENAVKNAFTQKQALINLGLRAAGSNFKTLKKYIKEYSIDISHFDSNKIRIEKLKQVGLSRKIPLSKILIENSTYDNGTNLKEKLYKEGLKERKCEMCGQGELWNGKRMSLIIDHINGTHNDNRIENLRIVCPNCAATLDTHCGKNLKKYNKKKMYFCKNCGEKKQKGAGLCRKCSDNAKRVVERPSLDELRKSINEIGYSATGRKYGVSDNSIRKWIKNYENKVL